MHRACDILFGMKIKGNELSLDDFKAIFKTNWFNLCEEVTIWGEDSKEHLLEQGLLAAEDFYNTFYKKLKPIATEYEYRIDRGEGKLPIKCIADLITEDGTIYDFKFGRGLWGAAVSSEYMTNMTTYAWAYQLEHGVIPKIKIIKQKWTGSRQPSGKKLWSHKCFEVDNMPITQEWIDYYKQLYDTVEEGINKGIFLPASDNNGLCKGCSFRGNECNVVIMS